MGYADERKRILNERHMGRGTMSMLKMADSGEAYLSVSEYIDWTHPAIMAGAEAFKKRAEDEVHLVRLIYEYVRDEIKHSWDVQDRRVTRRASEVWEHRVGICWAKSNLLAALLRACGIPVGICYQRLTLGDTPDTGYCIHSLNAVYIKSLGRWIRLDARGSAGVPNAQFDLEREQLEFRVNREIGEVDYRTVYACHMPGLMKVLEENEDALEMYQYRLPDTLYAYRRAAVEDVEELVSTRLTVLRAANGLSEEEPLGAVERASRDYYRRALGTGEHIAYLIYDEYGERRFIGAGGVSFYQVMPTRDNPDGRKAYIMNMYTAPEYRRQGIAEYTLDLLVRAAGERGISHISLEATETGRPLYQKYGFVAMENEMKLPHMGR